MPHSVEPTVVVTTNNGKETWQSEWTIRKRLQTLVPDVQYEIKALRRESEWQFSVSSDLSTFLSALTEMKLKTEGQISMVDLHVRNLPWGWPVKDIEAMLRERFPQKYERKTSKMSIL